MTTDLKACPFCGGVAFVYQEMRHLFQTGCRKCECTGSPGSTEAEAIAAWNTRVEGDADAEIIPKIGEHWLVKMPNASALSENEVVELRVSAIRLQELPMRRWLTPTWYALADIQLVECIKSTGEGK